LSYVLVARHPQETPRNFRQLPGWQLAGVIVPVLTIPILIFVCVLANPASFGLRAHQERLSKAQSIAGRYRLISEQADADHFDYFAVWGQGFEDLRPALPSRPGMHPNAHDIIIALDKKELRDTGVIVNHYGRWIYFGHARAAAFADGHAELVLISDLPTRLKKSNTLRASMTTRPAAP
jgi:hypothetical protein